MTDVPKRPCPPPRRDRSHAARQAAKLKKTERQTRIIGLLNRGVSIAEIAEREGVSLNRMRKVVSAILAARAPGPPAEYLALQLGRLNEAMIISYSAMYNPETGANFKAIDSVAKLIREMDRYHGFAPASLRPTPDPARLSAPCEPPLALPAPALDRVGNGAATD